MLSPSGTTVMHALIIEDQKLFAMLVEDELRELGYTSFDAADTEDAAIEAAGLRRPDLITADQRLASGLGVSASRAICFGIVGWQRASF